MELEGNGSVDGARKGSREGVKGEKKDSSVGSDWKDEDGEMDRDDEEEAWGDNTTDGEGRSEGRLKAGVKGEAVVGGVSESESKSMVAVDDDVNEHKLELGEWLAGVNSAAKMWGRWVKFKASEGGVNTEVDRNIDEDGRVNGWMPS
ncbi:hypothetical protein CROQUDRAFT_131998 [Cronartium quercuum f. sp. fusiforme G11]|uniref:Uncharacterized protein n=1 Tax=Cronartium quercuum f. sp. fusiforme G11 TaxID=708437 RepID=A0A9P6NLU7_9BASI|nr:hypothetical protein CROQUDRAFT_131998 [Cronartium quercuum f. sp. fusiforme G11]